LIDECLFDEFLLSSGDKRGTIFDEEYLNECAGWMQKPYLVIPGVHHVPNTTVIIWPTTYEQDKQTKTINYLCHIAII
jgi:hypothetical protein